MYGWTACKTSHMTVFAIAGLVLYVNHYFFQRTLHSLSGKQISNGHLQYVGMVELDMQFCLRWAVTIQVALPDK